MSSTRSFVSQVSYWTGIIFTAAFAGRARFGDEPELEEEVEAAWVRVVDEAVATEDAVAVIVFPSDDDPDAETFVDISGSIVGSGGGRGGLGVGRRFPDDLGSSTAEDRGGAGGEY